MTDSIRCHSDGICNALDTKYGREKKKKKSLIIPSLHRICFPEFNKLGIEKGLYQGGTRSTRDFHLLALNLDSGNLVYLSRTFSCSYDRLPNSYSVVAPDQVGSNVKKGCRSTWNNSKFGPIRPAIVHGSLSPAGALLKGLSSRLSLEDWRG
ncbi:hypothetical protein ASPWEDRAFT_351164 [Aspergillus wentii DTO 134E9]|uniref:Uncharacterized protein n=1 Tax=Aspergillus wentii DTO 134E9 TaxID=1073089 RepID=A0A1L9RVU9_ASPWE|nr:uncharacterized protein ASPWEDRAFT_351164 [Aspergillus wentii DTO 134E9]OJJ39003.1 hypothetical protein ASPWEDRAFT_351164 [Aspergillus wentii DTO 134E9]